ncbi:uncharacterized protein JCM15063_001482 [Sporobolomyces koalae]|uniref:uncharacterized protein n=1 Tax=Sporobolomyces koalae TaxID=500713 RepID=UPI00316BDC82
MERTVAVLFTAGNDEYEKDLEASFEASAFVIVTREWISGAELEEAGIDLGLEVGDDAYSEDVKAQTKHRVWALEREDAVQTLIALTRSFTSALPDIRTFAAPTSSAASMLLEHLFRSLDVPDSSGPASPAEVQGSGICEESESLAARPFPLSNSALNADATSLPASHRVISPKIAHALEKLELESTSAQYGRSPDSIAEDVEGAELDHVLTSLVPRDIPQRRSGSSLSTSCSSTASSRASSTSFRARPAPPPPTAQVRMTKAAALRLGVPVPLTPRRTSSTSSAETVLSVSTVSQRMAPKPKSLAAPAITPRLSRTAALRTGQVTPSNGQTPRPAKRQSISTSERAALDRLTRRQSVPLPVVAPSQRPEVRLSKAAKLRMGMPIPSSATRSSQPRASSDGRSIQTMSLSSSLKSLREPVIASRPSAVSESPTMARRSGVAILEDANCQDLRQTGVTEQSVTPAPSAGRRLPGHKRRESVVVPLMHQAPSHTPRANRASLLRQKSEVPISSSPSVPLRRAALTGQVQSTDGTMTTTPRLNRAALLRQKAVEAKEQLVPTTSLTPKRTILSRPGSALSNSSSNGGRI